MPEFANAPDQLAALSELDAWLRGGGVASWLVGGWAVDVHAGRVTRAHGDLDVALWAADRARLAARLLGRRWGHRPEPGEDGSTPYVRDAIRLDGAFLARDERGRVYTPRRDGRGEWPAGSFGHDVRALGGVRAHVVGREALIADKSAARADPATAAQDRADVRSLSPYLDASRPSEKPGTGLTSARPLGRANA